MSLRLKRFKFSPNYYIRGTVQKHRIFESTGTDQKALAEAYRIKRAALCIKRT